MMRFTFATILALTAFAFTTTALGNLPPPTGPVPAHSPTHFWLTATFTATPSDYGGRCGTGFYIDFTGVITGSAGAHIGYMFQYGGTQTKPVYVTLDAPITVSDRLHFTTHTSQPVGRYVDHLELLLAPVPPSKDPILWTTKVAEATSHCTQFQPPQK